MNNKLQDFNDFLNESIFDSDVALKLNLITYDQAIKINKEAIEDEIMNAIDDSDIKQTEEKIIKKMQFFTTTNIELGFYYKDDKNSLMIFNDGEWESYERSEF